MVGLKVGPIFYTIGNGSLLHSFFSTIAYHLEETKWGSKFPFLMNDLYRLELERDNIDNAIEELKSIKKGLENFLLKQ